MSTCDFQGNSDTYGLGIRLGLYFQWFTSFLAGTLAPEEAGNFVDINRSFMITVFIALVYVTATRGDTLATGSLYAVEAWILLVLCMTGGFAIVVSRWRRMYSRSRSDEDSGVAARFWGVVHFAAVSAINCYGVWFYSTGMDHMVHTSCSESIFLFKRLDLFGRYRTASLTFHAFFISSFLLGILLSIWQKWKLRHVPTSENFPRAEKKIPDPQIESVSSRGKRRTLLTRVLRSTVLAVYGGFLILSCIMIEMTIRYNYIQGVQSLNSTGQLLPFAVGVVGLLQLLSKVKPQKLLSRSKVDNAEEEKCTCKLHCPTLQEPSPQGCQDLSRADTKYLQANQLPSTLVSDAEKEGSSVARPVVDRSISLRYDAPYDNE